MKKIITLGILLVIFGLSIMYHDDISEYIINNLNLDKRESTKLENNKYASKSNYEFVKLTNNFEPTNKQDIYNIYYTVINSGLEEFTFYCSKKYKDCLDDIDYISNNQKLLSNINNFVPVYNSFKNIETEFDDLGKITIKITHIYNENEINEIEKRLDEIINNIITVNMTDEEKIKAVHDYIINNTKYDKDKSDKKIDNHHSDTAYGTLIDGYAVCGGYADSMKLFLDRFEIPNFKVSSENHVWNVLYLNNKWIHIDLTWDDPITNTGEDVLEYSYYLITTDELHEIEKEQHQFDTEVYKELKESTN